MPLRKLAASAILLAALAGCTNVQLKEAQVAPFDASRYSQRAGLAPVAFGTLNIRSTAEPLVKHECPNDACISQGSRGPIETPTEFSEQLQSDLKTYFGHVLTRKADSERRLNVHIHKAQAYKTIRMPGAGWIPVVGIFVPNEYKIGFLVGVSVSVFEQDKLVRTFDFERRIETVDPVSQDSKITYTKALEEYRRVLFAELDRDLVSRLDAPSDRAVTARSLADELKKLAELHESGVLTEAEFERAKQSLITREVAR